MADSGAPAAGMDLAEATLPADAIKVRVPLHCAASLRALRVGRGGGSDANAPRAPPAAALQADAHGRRRQGRDAHQARGRAHLRRRARPGPRARSCGRCGGDVGHVSLPPREPVPAPHRTHSSDALPSEFPGVTRITRDHLPAWRALDPAVAAPLGFSRHSLGRWRRRHYSARALLSGCPRPAQRRASGALTPATQMARQRRSAAALIVCAVVALLSLGIAAADATGEVRRACSRRLRRPKLLCCAEGETDAATTPHRRPFGRASTRLCAPAPRRPAAWALERRVAARNRCCCTRLRAAQVPTRRPSEDCASDVLLRKPAAADACTELPPRSCWPRRRPRRASWAAARPRPRLRRRPQPARTSLRRGLAARRVPPASLHAAACMVSRCSRVVRSSAVPADASDAAPLFSVPPRSC